MPKPFIKGTPDKGLQDDTNKEYSRAKKREELFQKIQPPARGPRREGLTQAETKAEIAKQKARNAELQRRRGAAPPVKYGRRTP